MAWHSHKGFLDASKAHIPPSCCPCHQNFSNIRNKSCFSCFPSLAFAFQALVVSLSFLSPAITAVMPLRLTICLQILVCTDLWKDKAALHAAYCDSAGVTEAFIKNGFANALSVASGSALKPDLNSWTYDVVVNERDKQVHPAQQTSYVD